MGQKLHRGRRSVFRKKRHPALRALGWGVLCVAVVAVGFLGAKYFTEHPQWEPDTGLPDDQPTVSSPVEESGDASTPEDRPADPIEPTPNISDAIRAFYLPHTALLDNAALDKLLSQAAAAGFNSVVFDVKDAAGNLYYRFTSATAGKVNAFTEDALTAERLSGVFSHIREAGMVPIPRLYAFEDHAGARALSTARITHESNPGWVWYDADPNNGGRAWLNPYADEAHSYIIELAQEMKAAGAAAVILDGVRFPDQLSAASFGDSANTALEKDKVLALFVEKTREALGDCPVILACTAQSALGNQTQVYGNNPLTFAPTMAAPMILPSALPQSLKLGDHTVQNDPNNLQPFVEGLVAQMILRTKVLESGKQPELIPFLQAEGCSAAQIKAQMEGCIAGGADSYILYDPAGAYDFAAY
ncbi:MAG: hypothetical protein IKU51_01510 [Clostridia bacterium]|nr:hypothetical protein [Clostridia bacterium]